MALKKQKRVRNASKARNSFVTKRAETKLSALADLFKAAAGERWAETRPSVLKREITFDGFRYLDGIELIYNWENRFMAVSYNLQIVTRFSTEHDLNEDTEGASFILKCKQKGVRSINRDYTWHCRQWKDEDTSKRDAYIERLNNPLIQERLSKLDIFEMTINHKKSWDYWYVTVESLIGSATWMLIPPVMSMITPKLDECVAFLELLELLGDALINNKEEDDGTKE